MRKNPHAVTLGRAGGRRRSHAKHVAAILNGTKGGRPRTNPDRLLHAFVTTAGLPPDAATPPACGATLTSAYNGHGAPRCPACERLVS